MNQTTIVIIAVIVVLVILFLIFRGRKQKVRFDATAAAPPAMAPPPPAMPVVQPKTPAPAPIAETKAVPAPPIPAAGEDHGVGAEMTAAIEDVVDQFVGITARASGQDQVSHVGDDLTQLKGLGPKAATSLHALGVTTFAQMAAWDDGDIDAIDAQLGAFKGRIRRDRWVEQAQYLAKGDTAGFEAAFGKLG
jgi:predicted flap endonuclease-1-like 5' DNA nuclease